MKQENRNKGRRGEEEAARLLIGKGYTMVERNWGNKFGEIDIIARDRETLVFVEVKAKTGEEMGTPEEMVGRGKLNRIKHMASIYLDGRDVLCRIDVVAVVYGREGDLKRITHYQNVS